MLVSMASSSSSSSNIKIKSDVLWMQAKHVWNGEEDHKLHIRRVVPTYQGEEEIPEEIIPLLRQCGFYWIIKMGYLKINASLITALIERWRPETHTFHMRCGECTITLQDVSVLLGMRVGGAPLIGQTNLDWAELCEELLGEESYLLIKAATKFPYGTYNFYGTLSSAALMHRDLPATDYKIKSIGGMCILIQMWAWKRCTTLAPKRTPPVIQNKPLGHRWLRRGNQHIGNDDLIVFRRKLDIMKRHEFLWESYTATVMSSLPLICLVGSVAWCAVVPLICFHVVEWHQPDRLLAPMISRWNNRAEFRVDVYPRQEGLLRFNSDYMVWYRRKTKMFVDPNNANRAILAEVAETLQYMVSPQGRNTWKVDDLVPYVEKITILSEEQERITEPAAHGPTSERRFPPRREVVEAQEYDKQIEERGHGMYYMPPTFAEYPSQMYQYSFQGHHTDMFASSHSFGGVAETHPHFSWPTMAPAQQHDAPMATPDAPLAPQWNVPGAIPDMGDLLDVDLRQEFFAEAEEVQAARYRGRRNPDRQARRWDRPCGTSSRHHGHDNE
ncbi:Serine/threonine-protein phosphatase 7 long form [Glycine soja]